jgi:hypothetical protein
MWTAAIAVGKFLKAVPLWVYVLIGAGIAIYAYGEYKENVGEATVQLAWDAQKKLDKEAADKDKMFRDVSTSVTHVVYKERLRTITEKGETIVRIQENFVPVDSGYLPSGFRVYYDAAVTNTIPDTASIATGTPVAVADVARISAINYAQCNKAYALVDGWNEWADKQCALNPKGCPNVQ